MRAASGQALGTIGGDEALSARTLWPQRIIFPTATGISVLQRAWLKSQPAPKAKRTTNQKRDDKVCTAFAGCEPIFSTGNFPSDNSSSSGLGSMVY